MRTVWTCALLIAVGCAHKDPEAPPPKTISWRDTALGERAPGPAPVAAVTASDEDPRIESGQADPKVVGGLVRERLLSVKRCYEAGVAKNAKLAGRVELFVDVDGDGRVLKAKTVRTTLGDPGVERCIVDAAKQWLIKKPGGGAFAFVYPLVFEPSASSANAAQSEEPEEDPVASGDPLEVKSAADLQSCYDKFAKGKEGTAILQLSVLPSKKVVGIKVTGSTIKRPKFDACVAAAAKSWPYPDVKKRTDVKLPLAMNGEKAMIAVAEDAGGEGGDGAAEANIPDDVAEKLGAALRAKLAALTCGDKAPKLKGNLGLGLRISKDGKIPDAIITQSELRGKPGAEAVEKCVVDAAKKWTLVPIPQQIEIEIPVSIPPEK